MPGIVSQRIATFESMVEATLPSIRKESLPSTNSVKPLICSFERMVETTTASVAQGSLPLTNTVKPLVSFFEAEQQMEAVSSTKDMHLPERVEVLERNSSTDSFEIRPNVDLFGEDIRLLGKDRKNHENNVNNKDNEEECTIIPKVIDKSKPRSSRIIGTISRLIKRGLNIYRGHRETKQGQESSQNKLARKSPESLNSPNFSSMEACPRALSKRSKRTAFVSIMRMAFSPKERKANVPSREDTDQSNQVPSSEGIPIPKHIPLSPQEIPDSEESPSPPIPAQIQVPISKKGSKNTTVTVQNIRLKVTVVTTLEDSPTPRNAAMDSEN